MGCRAACKVSYYNRIPRGGRSETWPRVCDAEVEDLPKCRPIERNQAYYANPSPRGRALWAAAFESQFLTTKPGNMGFVLSPIA